MSKIVIQVNGGVVQDVFIIQKEIKKLVSAVVVDFDSEGADDPKMTTVNKDLYACIGEIGIKDLKNDSDVYKLLEKYFQDEYDSYAAKHQPRRP